MEVKYEGISSWPGTTQYKVPSQNAALARHVMRRINEASGPYQMFYTLGDGMVLRPPTEGTPSRPGEWTLQYMEDIPIDYFTEREALRTHRHNTACSTCCTTAVVDAGSLTTESHGTAAVACRVRW